MKYIVHNEEVSRDIYYFCEKAKEENKKFVLLKADSYYDLERYIINYPQYDYYICIDRPTDCYYTKGQSTVSEWYFNERTHYTASVEEVKSRYENSKTKDTLTFEDWCKKYKYVFKTETDYDIVYNEIPKVGDDFIEEVQTKFFSVKVNNEDAVKTINELNDEHLIEYVLRNDFYTEIIYIDDYLEIKEDE